MTTSFVLLGFESLSDWELCPDEGAGRGKKKDLKTHMKWKVL